MPTKNELIEIAKEKKIPIKASLKKEEMIKLLGSPIVRELEYANKISDVRFKKGYIDEDQKQFEKIFEKKHSDFYVAVLKKDKDLVLVKGSHSGKGLGKGGAKWNFLSAKL